MVTAELTGRYEAPIYGMLAVNKAIDDFNWKTHGLEEPAVILNGQPEDRNLRENLLEAGTIRFKPSVLTAAAAMIGAAVILTDPIFQGLEISLLFGFASSTLLTVFVVPAIYMVLRDDGRPFADTPA